MLSRVFTGLSCGSGASLDCLRLEHLTVRPEKFSRRAGVYGMGVTCMKRRLRRGSNSWYLHAEDKNRHTALFTDTS